MNYLTRVLSRCDLASRVVPYVERGVIQSVHTSTLNISDNLISKWRFCKLSPEAKERLLTRFSASEVLASMKLINCTLGKLAGRTNRAYIIQKPEQLIADVIEGKFVGFRTPVIKDLTEIDGLSLPVITWRELKEGDCISLDGKIGAVADVASSLRVKPFINLTSLQQVNRLFQYFKDTIPSEYAGDGCAARCIWMVCIMQKIMKISSVRRIIIQPDGKKALSPIKLFPRAIAWQFHVTPLVIVNTEAIVLDLVLQEPIPYKQWRAAIHPDAVKVTVSDEVSIDAAELDAKENGTVGLSGAIGGLKGLYLHDRVANNNPYYSTKGWLV